MRSSRSSHSAVSIATRSASGAPLAFHHWVYTRSSRALSYSIFSKCGTTQSASTEYRAKPPPSWSYRPPRAIAWQLASTISSAAGTPVRAWWRSRKASAVDGGNFGAAPNPPRSASNSRTSPYRARCSSCSPGGPAAGFGSARSVSSRWTCPEISSTSARRSTQAWDTEPSSCRKDGIPGRGSGGK